MKYSLVIAPRALTHAITTESKRLLKNIYGKDVEGVYYRVKTVEQQENPRRVFMKGDGEILEFEVRPHITLVQDLDFPEEKRTDFVKKIAEALINQSEFVLNPIGIGDYNQSFTFYIEFQQNHSVENLFKKVLSVSKNFLPKEKFVRYTQKVFIPHTTIIYDDIDPEKIKKAEEQLDKNIFSNPINVSEIELWELTPQEQKIIKSFSLLKIL